MAKDSLQDFQELLRKLFQFDVADLDFGIYRILNQKRTDIERFIQEDLVAAVNDGLADLQAEQQKDAAGDLAMRRQAVIAAFGDDAFVADGLAPHVKDFPVAKQYAEAVAKAGAAKLSEQTERRVYDDLTRFFGRYYESGDFVSKRRFTSRRSKYYVPYDGEEVLLHWANRDQYYIKTSERFADYHFTAGNYAVHFELNQAAVPQDNVKVSDRRYFVLHGDEPVAYDADAKRLTVRFAYRPLTEDEDETLLERYNEGQTKSGRRKTSDRSTVCAALEGLILEQVPDAALKATLAQARNGTEKTILGTHLNRYTARNTSDYFVHKDLGGFLREQLDFYLKNEVLHLDDVLGDGSGQALQHALVRAKVVRKIGERIIAFLAQIEDFQKRLFEKKKFVVQTDYCVTLDRVPKALYDHILGDAGEAQREAWKALYQMEDWGEDLGYNGTIGEAFLESHPYLMVDTAFFGQAFKDELLASFEHVNEAVEGLIINGDNFQALNLLQEAYRGRVSCIYIDPPYNTGNDGFVYKDNYQHSSWLTMMENRLHMARKMMPKNGVIFSSIDDDEQENLRQLMNQLFGEGNFVANLIWQKKYSPANDATWFSDDHDHVLVYADQKEVWRPERLPRTEEQNKAYTNPDGDFRGPWKSSDYTSNKSAEERPNLFYPITNPHTAAEVWPSRQAVWRYSKEYHERNAQENRVWWGIEGTNSVPAYKRFLSEVEGVVPRTIWSYKDAGHNQDAVRELQALFKENPFTSPKPTKLVHRIMQVAKGEVMLDFFAGSGTTGHAVMSFNRENDTLRRYVLVEMGEYFDTVLKPRLMKVAFTANWKEGVPQDLEGQSHVIKYHVLESYEDALNNLVVQQPEDELRALLYDTFDDYQLHYMLAHETKGSPSLLAQDAFEKPFAYTVQIQRGHATPAPTVVDLEETFNYLIGLRVRQRRVYEHQGRRCVVVRGTVETETGFESTVVFWRDTEGLDYEAEAVWAAEAVLSEPLDRVYVNGPSHIKGAEPLEIVFRTRMDAGASTESSA